MMFYLLCNIKCVFSRIKVVRKQGWRPVDGWMDADWGFQPPHLWSLAGLTPKHLICPSCDMLEKGSVRLSVSGDEEQAEKNPPTLSPWTSDHVPPSQHAVHRPSGGGGLIWVTKCSSEGSGSVRTSMRGKKTILWQQQTASLHPVFARTTAKAAASGKHPPHSGKVEVLWGTDVLRVSSSVSSKRPQQPSPVGRQDLCSGSVNGKKMVAAFQGHEWSTANVVPNWKQQLKSNNSLAFSVFPYLGIWAEQKSSSCWWGQSQAKAGRFQTNIFRVVEFYLSQ